MLRTGDLVKVSSTGEFTDTDETWIYLCELPEAVMQYTVGDARYKCQCIRRHGAAVVGCVKAWRFVEAV